MNGKIWTLGLMMLLLTWIIPQQGYAASESIQLSPISDVYPGREVVITGTSIFEEVIVKVLDPHGRIFFFEVATVNEQGEFQVKWNMPSQAPRGTYEVVAGQGSDVATGRYQLRSAQPPIMTDPSDGSAPSDALEGMLGADAYVESLITTEGGIVTQVIKFNLEQVKQSYLALAQRNKPLELTLSLEKQAPNVEFQFPFSLLEEAGAWDSAGLKIQFGDATYVIPLSALAGSNNVLRTYASNADAYAVLRISEAEEELAAKLRNTIALQSGELHSHVMALQWLAEVDGQRIALENMGAVWITSSFEMLMRLDDQHSTAIYYDVHADQLHFVPSLFAEQADSTLVTMKQHRNGLYAIVSFQRSFPDVAGHWAEETIERLASKWIIHGMSEIRFAPDEAVTRAQFLSMIVRSLGLPVGDGTAAFSDIHEENWYAEAVRIGVQYGLVSGFADGTFRPDEVLTREQAAVILYRALQLNIAEVHLPDSEYDTLSLTYHDAAQISEWAQEAMAKLNGAGLMQGTSSTTLNPQGTATRAQAATLLMRMLQQLEFINR